MPVIKTTFAPFDAKEFVSVQTMTDLPPSLVFPMDFVYTKKKNHRNCALDDPPTWE